MLDYVYLTKTKDTDDTPNKHYKKYYEDLTLSDENIPTIEKISTKKYYDKEKEFFLEDRYLQHRRKINPFQYLKVEKLAFAFIGFASFIMLFLSIYIGKITLLISSATVFIAVWIGIILTFFITRIVNDM